MSKTKLGFVKLTPAEVVHLAETELTRLAEDRETRRLHFLSHFVNKPVGFIGRLFGRKPLTEETAIAMIEDDMWLGYEYAYLKPSWESPRQEALKKIVTVGNALLDGRGDEIEVSIEIASVLFRSNDEQS